jgi:predicted pyridoxine 5'-phosphate oxidase superfamily flavin-nucleotide-binding protein
MKIPQSVRDEIARGPLAHLTTLNKDGSPQVTVIWAGIEDEEFVIGHLALHHKIKNIRRDPRVALSFIGQNTRKECANTSSRMDARESPRAAQCRYCSA